MAITPRKGREPAFDTQDECPHFLLQPKWRTPEDLGLAEKAYEYVCESCGKAFLPGSPCGRARGRKRSLLQVIEAFITPVIAGREEASRETDDALHVLHIDRALLKKKGQTLFVSTSERRNRPEEEPSDGSSGSHRRHPEPGTADVPYRYVVNCPPF